MEGRPGWVGLGGLVKYRQVPRQLVYTQMVNHLSTNPAQLRVTLLMALMQPTTFPPG